MALTPDKNIGLNINSLDKETIDKILDRYREYVGLLVIDFPETLLYQTEIIDNLWGWRKTYDLRLMVDYQLSGGFDAMVERLRFETNKCHPELITASAAVTEEGLDILVNSTKAGVLATGILPEISDNDHATVFESFATGEFTKLRAKTIKKVGGVGVYGAAKEALDYPWKEEGLEYIASGISPNGIAYGRKKQERVLRLSEALSVGATTVVIGSSININLNDGKFTSTDDKVEQFEKMIEGVN